MAIEPKTPSQNTTRPATLQNGPAHEEDTAVQTKDILRDFLKRLQYRSPRTQADPKLRAEVAAEIASWNAGLSQKAIEYFTETTSCAAESAYAHTTYEHRRAVAIYTAYWNYMDDVAGNPQVLAALGQFGRRFVIGEDLADPVLERMVTLLRSMDKLYTGVGAECIIAGTLDALAGTYVEYKTKEATPAPGAVRYPYWLRLKAGVAGPFAHFNFMNGWRDPSDNYHLQLIPEIEHFIVAVNDILSFYKETLSGETDTYIHLRAAAESKPPLAVLRELVDETLDTVRRTEGLTSADPQLASICRSFFMGYTEFHFRAGRYRLEDLQVDS
ncbi:terpenoid synthase [Trametes maxima]|nr:terpenoid synthase [Trametes maxima]